MITKKDLQYDYSWTTYGSDDPEVTGTPDSTLLNRKEGYEVLYFINKFMEIHDLERKASGLKIEDMIHKCPSNIRSQEKVKNWIEDNWKKY